MGARNIAVVFSALLLSIAAFCEPRSGMNLEGFSGNNKQKTSGRHNPFSRAQEKVSVQSMRVSAIVYSDTQRAALISGKIVQVGDKIGASKVVEIERKHVTLRNQNGVFRLSIDRAIDDRVKE